MPLLGAKEGLAHLCLAQLDAGDAALVADPGYPVYRGGPAIAGAEAIPLPLRAEHGFLPDLDAVADADARRANLLICGYPNNPTGAVAEPEFMQRLARFGIDRGVPIAHDNAYAELTYDGYVAPSFLAAPDGVEAGIEIYSLSKSLNMPGWRVAFAVGNGAMLQNLTRLKTNVDSGMFLALQRTAIAALDMIGPFTEQMRELYRRRRDLVCAALARHRGRGRAAARGIYVWAPTPPGVRSEAFADRLLAEAGVVVGAGLVLRRVRRGLHAALADRAGGPPRRGHGAHRHALHLTLVTTFPPESALRSPRTRRARRGAASRRGPGRARRDARAARAPRARRSSARSCSTASAPDAKTYIGSGKVDELRARCKRAARREVVVCEDDLSPNQQRASRGHARDARRRPHARDPRHLRRCTRTAPRASSRSSSRSSSTTCSACAACGSTSSGSAAASAPAARASPSSRPTAGSRATASRC